MPDLTRAQHLEDLLGERGLDVLLVTDLVDVRYLTGFTGSAGLALVGPGTRRFVTDFRYLSQSADQLDAAWERQIETDGLKAAAASVGDGPLQLGFDDAKLTVRQHARLRELLPEGVELVAAGGLVEELRLVKDEEELEQLRAAAALADEALTEVLGRGLAGRTEQDVALDLEFTMRRKGASGASFPSIVASGAHGALPHAEPRDVVIPEDVLVTIDWGCVLDGYNSDCTRTYATGEGVDARDREVFELVLQAQLAALEAVRPGPTGKEVDAVARDLIDAAGHAEHFGHGLGHGVGLEVHEGPRLSKQGSVALAPGHVVTVEPGVYVPGATGVRIEDLAVVTPDGHEVLSHLPKELQVIAPASRPSAPFAG